MNLSKTMKLLEKHEICPACGNDRIGGGEGTMVVDDNTFTRSCKCGWSVTVTEEAANSETYI